MFVCDTNVISESFRPRPALAVAEWMKQYRQDQFWLSELTIAELRLGIENCTDVERRSVLMEWLGVTVRRDFAGRTLPVTEDILFRWILVGSRCAAKGKTLPQGDALIAATAIEHKFVVATRDVAPFVLAGAMVLNPWTGERFNGA